MRLRVDSTSISQPGLDSSAPILLDDLTEGFSIDHASIFDKFGSLGAARSVNRLQYSQAHEFLKRLGKLDVDP